MGKIENDFSWGTPEQTAVDALKRSLQEAADLYPIDYHKRFTVTTDASKTGMGAVLSQQDESGFLRPVQFMSHRCTKAESDYGTNLELGAVVLAVRTFAVYLRHRFTLETDPQPFF